LPAPNLVERRIEGSTEVLLLAPSPDLTERDVAYAEYDAAALKPRVILHLTPVGMDKLASLTQENIGRRLAIFIDGKHLATALIPGKMPDGRLSLMNFASPAEAQRVAGALARR
jgi:preprotein translocase subunit SecD